MGSYDVVGLNFNPYRRNVGPGPQVEIRIEAAYPSMDHVMKPTSGLSRDFIFHTVRLISTRIMYMIQSPPLPTSFLSR
jgi:hypothetical protein